MHEHLASVDEVTAAATIPEETNAHRDFNFHCNDSDGKNFCDCQHHAQSTSGCMHFGRPVTPLAFSLASNPINVNEQHASPLFGIIPTEIRQEIWTYALTDCTSRPYGVDFEPRGRYCSAYELAIPQSDIAVPLLQTCKIAYMETYKLPFLLNPFIVYKIESVLHMLISRPRLEKLFPWQFALISRLDITGGLMVTFYQGDKLPDHLESWRAQERHRGSVIAPRFYAQRYHFEPEPYRGDLKVHTSFLFGVVQTPGNEREDGMEFTLQTRGTTFYDTALWKFGKALTVASTDRVMVARPLTHFTLRLSRTDWDRWQHDPTTGGEIPPEGRLALDPACNDDESDPAEIAYPLYEYMMNRTAERRAGVTTRPMKHGTSSWGADVSMMPDLEQFELVMETFGLKREQLEDVVDCAKWWRFPLDGSSDELVWDGKVEELRYRKRLVKEGDEKDESKWYFFDHDVEVRIMRFRRVKGTLDSPYRVPRLRDYYH